MSRISILIVLAIIFNVNNNLKASNIESNLTPQQEKIVTISAFAAKGELEKLKIELNDGLDSGLTVNEIKEEMRNILNKK